MLCIIGAGCDEGMVAGGEFDKLGVGGVAIWALCCVTEGAPMAILLAKRAASSSVTFVSPSEADSPHYIDHQSNSRSTKA